MTAPCSISAITAGRLCKLLNLLGSDHVGERASAALKADQLIRLHGLSWPDLIGPTGTPRSCTGAVDDLVDLCLANAERLTDWERFDFLPGIRGRQHLSEKQMHILRDIAEKVRRTAA